MAVIFYFNSAVKSITFLGQTITESGSSIDTSSVVSGNQYTGNIEFNGVVDNMNYSYTPNSGSSSKNGTWIGGVLSTFILQAGTSGLNGTYTINATVIELPNPYEITMTDKKLTIECKDTIMEDNLAITANLQEKTVTPTKEPQEVSGDSGYVGLEKVIVNPIPTDYIIPSGTLEVIANGEVDCSNYEKVSVNVPASVVEEWDGSYTESDLGYTVTLEGFFGSTIYGYLSYQVNGGEVISCEGKTSPIVIEGVQNIVFTKSGVSSHINIGTTTGGSDVGGVRDGHSLTYTPTQDITLYCTEVGGGSD